MVNCRGPNRAHDSSTLHLTESTTVEHPFFGFCLQLLREVRQPQRHTRQYTVPVVKVAHEH